MDFSVTKDLTFYSTFNKADSIINESDYIEFMMNFGDGFYLDKSLHLYGFGSKNNYHNIDYINQLLKEKYIWVNEIESIVFFGQDVFGNQFIKYSKGYGIMYLDSGEIEFIAENFSSWLNSINNDKDYFTGHALILDWYNHNFVLEFGERLIPKIPFILGGEYIVENLYTQTSVYAISLLSELALQINTLPDGAKIKFEIKN